MSSHTIVVTFIDGSGRDPLSMEADSAERIVDVLGRYGLMEGLQTKETKIRDENGAVLDLALLQNPNSIVEATPARLELGGPSLEDGEFCPPALIGYNCDNPNCPAKGRGTYRLPLWGYHTPKQLVACKRAEESAR